MVLYAKCHSAFGSSAAEMMRGDKSRRLRKCIYHHPVYAYVAVLVDILVHICVYNNTTPPLIYYSLRTCRHKLDQCVGEALNNSQIIFLLVLGHEKLFDFGTLVTLRVEGASFREMQCPTSCCLFDAAGNS